MRYCLALVLCLLPACMLIPPSPMERLSQSAYDLNTATRFGRMDVALGMVAQEAQGEFMARHKKWHHDIRIVDLEMQGVRMLTKETAEVQLAVSWHRDNETTIHESAISQKWTTSTGSGWVLDEERRVSGPPGVFQHVGARKAKNAHTMPEVQGLTTSDWQ
jgi:hypothetical protein